MSFDFNVVRLERCSSQDPIYDIEYFAKVSNPSGQQEGWEKGKLLRYLIRNQHWSPLEMVSCVFYVETTRDIARQLLRHRSMNFQEMSQRYAEVTSNFVFREGRGQDHKNRQNSLDNMSDSVKKEWEQHQASVALAVNNAYNWALGTGIAKEQARCVLPEGMTLSRLYVNANLRDMYHYINLRTSNGTQKEHMDLANKFKIAIETIAPELFEKEK
jgi:thymidylate synthase (FAD)